MSLVSETLGSETETFGFLSETRAPKQMSETEKNGLETFSRLKHRDRDYIRAAYTAECLAKQPIADEQSRTSGVKVERVECRFRMERSESGVTDGSGVAVELQTVVEYQLEGLSLLATVSGISCA
jgi:hypothetical protein